MIPLTNFLIGLVILICLSLLDFFSYNKKDGYIPAVFTTMFLILAFLINTQINMTIAFGILGGLIGILFTDLDLWSGLADFKVFVACSMLFNSFMGVALFGLILTILAVIVKLSVKWGVSQGKDWQIPFIPVILIAYSIAGALI